MLHRLILSLCLVLIACGAPVVSPRGEAPRGEGRGASSVVAGDVVALRRAEATKSKRRSASRPPAPPSADLLPGLIAERTEARGGELVLHGVTLPSAAGTLRAAELRLAGLRRDDGGLVADRLTARDLTLAATREGGAWVRLASVTLTGLVLPDACEAGARALVRLGCARWFMLAATGLEGADGPVGDAWRADLLTVTGFDRGRIDAARVEGVVVDRAAPGTMPTLPRLVARMAGAPLGLSGLAEADRLEADAIRLGGVDLGPMLGGEVTLSVREAAVRRPVLTRRGDRLSSAGSLTAREVEIAEATLMRAVLDVQGARADLGAGFGPAAAAAARRHGLSAARGAARMRFVREVDGARFDASWRVAGAAAGRLSLAFADDAPASVTGGEVIIDDQGALDGLFAVAAAADAQDPALLRRQVVGALTFAAMRASSDDPAARRAAKAFLTFAAEGGRLDVAIRPGAPVAPPALAAAPPAEAVRRLGLDVSVR